MKKENMNVLLMALSTLSRDVISKGISAAKEIDYSFEYSVNQKTYTTKAKYQLEPTVRILQDILIDQNETIDYIVLLNTEEVYEERPSVGEKRPSAFEYFKERIKDVVSEDKIIDTRRKTESKAPEYMKIVVDKIRKLKVDNSDKHIKLWVDNHGGLRDMQNILQGILPLLRFEGIQPECIFTIDMGKQGILRIDETFDIKNKKTIVDFTSALNEFINFGKAKNLCEFIEDSELKKILKKLSEAITICNTGRFEAQIYNLQEWIKKNKDGMETEYLGIFINVINESYKDILRYQRNKQENEYEKGKRIVKEIEWCLDKDFIQLAVTLIEAKIPEIMCGCGIYTYYRNENEKKEKNRTINKIKNENKKIEHILEGTFFVKEYKYGFKHYSKLKEFKKHQNEWLIPYTKLGSENREKIIEYLEKYNKLNKIRNDMDHVNPNCNEYTDVCEKIRDMITSTNEFINFCKEKKVFEEIFIKDYLPDFVYKEQGNNSIKDNWKNIYIPIIKEDEYSEKIMEMAKKIIYVFENTNLENPVEYQILNDQLKKIYGNEIPRKKEMTKNEDEKITTIMMKKYPKIFKINSENKFFYTAYKESNLCKEEAETYIKNIIPWANNS